MDNRDFVINENYHSSEDSNELELVIDKNNKEALEDEKNLFEFDITKLDEKPWNKPGEDITDYFNYGFNETTWKEYCNMQKGQYYKR
ncbi:FIP1-like 1 protein [Vairimorpha necatrix]|uniref:FIP1-like 1 protein n=1 Tax=Vairimorpha necatrix TaxID=6039 RepID=A0AAX4J8E5_9MICR